MRPSSNVTIVTFFQVASSEETVAAHAVCLPDYFHRVNQPFIDVSVNGAGVNVNKSSGV